MKQKVYICTVFYQCEISLYLTARLRKFFQQNSFEVLDQPLGADIILINTCGFVQKTEDRSLSFIRHYAKNYFGKKIIVCGCLAKINRRQCGIKGVSALIGPKELNKINKIFNSKVLIEDIQVNTLDRSILNNNKTLSTEFIENSGMLDDYYIQICQGCVNNCSFCSTKKAKGYVESKPVQEIIREFKSGIKAGFEKFVLLADDCGSYGMDIGADFAELLNEINNLRGLFKIKIYFIEPSRLIDLYPKINKNIFKSKVYYINAPVQTTSKRILRLMKRKFDIKSLLNIVNEIRALNPHVRIETVVMYGFPSETREELVDTFALGGYFDEIMYIAYSGRTGTPAFEYKGKISEKEKKNRASLIATEARRSSSKIVVDGNLPPAERIKGSIIH